MAIEVDKGRVIKSKGIALTHRDQGYSANNRPVSLLMKSDLAPNEITVDVLKALRQVTVQISMEEFLQRFFGLWSSDAQLLAKLLGFETELEDEALENPTDEWLQDYNARVQASLEEKMESITILKAANDGKELTLPEQFQLIKAQQAFEVASARAGLTFEANPETVKVVKTTQVQIDNTEEPIVAEEIDVTKSQAYIDLVKKNEDLIKKAALADDIIKANEANQKSIMITKASAMSFVAEDQRDAVATLLMKSDNVLVLTVLEKAQETIATLTAENTEIKKQFGEKEHGLNGDTTVQDTVDPQAILNANIAKAKEALVNKA